MISLLISGCKYVSIFIIVIFISFLAENYFRKADKANFKIKFSPLALNKNKILGFIFSGIAIFIISYFAGIRASDVGVDTSLYPVTLTRLARSYNSLFNFLNTSDVSSEYLGGIIVFISSRLTSDSSALLFFYQFFTILPIFIGGYYARKKVKLHRVIAVYLFLFFNVSLNLMRESIACAFCFAALSMILIDDRITFKSIILFIIAILFHRSGIFGVLLLLLVYLSLKLFNNKIKYLLYIIIIILPNFLSTISQTLVNYGLADEHLMFYFDVFLNKTVDKNWFTNVYSLYSISYLILSFIILLVPVINTSNFFTKKLGRNSNVNNDNYSLFKTLFTYNAIGYLMYIVLLFSLSTTYGGRFSMYYDYLYCLSLPLSVNGNNKKLKKFVVYFSIILYWCIWIMRLGWSGTSFYNIK